MAGINQKPKAKVPSMPDPSQPVWIAIAFLIPLFLLTSLQLFCEPVGLHLLVSESVLLLAIMGNEAVPAIDLFVDHVSINACRLYCACGCVDS